MKVSLELSGPNGKMWDFDMQYHNLPEAYAWEVAGAASALGEYIKNAVGGATAGQKSYSVTFRTVAEGAEPQGAASSSKADRLLYSQVVEMQKGGIELMQKLLLGAEMEIKSGQRT